MIDAAKLVRLSKDAPIFIQEYEAKQRLVESQRHIYDRTTDEDEKSILVRWIFNNEKWLRDNQTKYFISQKLVATDLSSIESLLSRINEIDTEIG